MTPERGGLRFPELCHPIRRHRKAILPAAALGGVRQRRGVLREERAPFPGPAGEGAGLLDTITREGPIAAALSLRVVFLIIFVSTRSLRASVPVIVPLVFGTLWTGG
jgi:hypothetical protein